MGAAMDWARILAYVTGTLDQELLARNEYLAAENHIMRAQRKGRLRRRPTPSWTGIARMSLASWVARSRFIRRAVDEEIARNVTMADCGALRDCRYLLHVRDRGCQEWTLTRS